MLLSESFYVPGEGYGPVIITATDTGVLKIDIGARRFAALNRGSVSLTKSGFGIFRAGRIWQQLARYAQGASLDVGSYVEVLSRVLLSLVERGHGGIVLVVGDDALTYLDLRYRATEPAGALREAIQFRAGDSLGPSARSYHYPIGSPPDPKTLELRFARERAVEEHQFVGDASTFAADLASIDGALVVSSDLTIVGFGAHIGCPQGEIQAQAAQDLAGTEFGESPLKSLGTRHNSAARLCYYSPGTLAFVVSQDGLVSAFLRDPEREFVAVWRPVTLEWHW